MTYVGRICLEKMKVAKTYGERWEVVRDLGKGGQGLVYLVRDLRTEYLEPMALKRVLNTQRYDRFVTEVTVGLAMKHPAIMRIVDHSPLDPMAASSTKQYFVMPYARAGSLADRADLYKGSIDSTLLAVKHMLTGLMFAHDAGVIHRDVKPENILFDSSTHEAILSDFGICLVRAEDRSTEADAAPLGPRYFMAPELEDGGKLDVSPAADLYSVGKLIYFMYSGGRRLPRERQRDPEFDLSDLQGVRSRSLMNLLDRLICPLNRRMQRAEEVITEIERIQDLDGRPGVATVSPRARTLVEEIVSRNMAKENVRVHNLAIQQRRYAALRTFGEEVSSWLSKELEVFAGSQSVPGQLEFKVEKVGSPEAMAAGLHLPKYDLVAFSAVQLKATVGRSRGHNLVFFVCFESGEPDISLSSATPFNDRPVKVRIVPYYAMDGSQTLHGFVRKRVATNVQFGIAEVHEHLLMGRSLVYDTTAEDWRTHEDSLKAAVDEAIEMFLMFLRKTADGAFFIGR